MAGEITRKFSVVTPETIPQEWFNKRLLLSYTVIANGMKPFAIEAFAFEDERDMTKVSESIYIDVEHVTLKGKDKLVAFLESTTPLIPKDHLGQYYLKDLEAMSRAYGVSFSVEIGG